jgi:hypothetical protein
MCPPVWSEEAMRTRRFTIEFATACTHPRPEIEDHWPMDPTRGDPTYPGVDARHPADAAEATGTEPD